MRRIGLLISVCFIFSLISSCGEEPKISSTSVKGETWYQTLWCNEQDGRAEVVMADKTRCDCRGAIHATEVDLCPKCTEATGQSLHYSRLTAKEAGLLLIVTDTGGAKYVSRRHNNINYFDLPIRVWTIDATDYRKNSEAKPKRAAFYKRCRILSVNSERFHPFLIRIANYKAISVA